MRIASFASMTVGAILQKRITREPAQVLPLQYGASLAACLMGAVLAGLAVVFRGGQR